MLHCIKCDEFVCYSFDLRKIEDAHHTVVSDDFSTKADMREYPGEGQAYGPMGDFVHTGKLYCGMCRREKGEWGIMAKYKGVPYPVLKITSFLLVDVDGKKVHCKHWKKVPFKVNKLTGEDIKYRIRKIKAKPTHE